MMEIKILTRVPTWKDYRFYFPTLLIFSILRPQDLDYYLKSISEKKIKILC